MKYIAYIRTSLYILLLLIVLSANAQDNERALAIAVEEIVLSDMNPKVVNEFVEEIYKKHCKSAYLASRIAKAYYMYSTNPETKERYFGRREPDTAFVYINRAIAIDPKYPDPYILASDILKYEKGAEGREEAMRWLNRGIAANPSDPSLYIASAKILALSDSEAAVAKLKALKQSNPNFPIELELGRLYWNMYNDIGGVTPFQEMADAYDKANKDDMTVGDLEAYSFALYATNQIDKMYDVSTYGVAKYPKSFMLNMNVFYGLVGLNRFSEAVKAGEKFISIVDKKTLEPIHYLRYGEALAGDKQYEKAIEQYNFVLNMEKATEKNKAVAYSHIESAIIAKASDNQKNGDYNQAFAIYKEYINKSKAEGKLTAYVLAMYARAYIELSEEQNGSDKEASLKKASDIYGEMGELFPDQKVPALNFQFITHVRLDPESEQGLAKPYAEQMITAILSKSDHSQDDSKLVVAYEYLSYYYFINSKYKDALNYADKALDIDPNSARASKIKEIAKKYVK